MASADLTKSDAATQRYFTTNLEPLVDPRDPSIVTVLSKKIRELESPEVRSSLELALRRDEDDVLTALEELRPDKPGPVEDNITAKLLARGGYNDVWLISSDVELDNNAPGLIVLRMPTSDSFVPHQVRNEVGWLKHMTKHHPSIPVPKVYAYSDGSPSGQHPFVAEEFIGGQPLSEAWKSYSELEKEEAARKIATIVIQLGEIRFDAVGGMQPNGSLGPTVEGVKLFKGRQAFHDPDCYNVGPYSTVKQYILAYYDKEIHYYANAPESAFDDDTFDTESRTAFVQRLKDKKTSVEAELKVNLRDEPFVLCHGDLQGRNFLMRGTEIAAIIDWEFAGSYPLSELVDGGVEVLEMEDDESTDECFEWCSRICQLVEEIAKARKWSQRDLELVMSEGHPLLQEARVEMMPEFE